MSKTERRQNSSGPIDILKVLERFDVTSAFKDKGDLRRWSAKRTVGGLIAATACHDIYAHGMSWPGVALCAISILPLVTSLIKG